MKKMNKKGFTIVELVIVISVIAILSAVMIPTFVGIVNKSKKSAAAQEADTALTAVLTEEMTNAANDYKLNNTKTYYFISGDYWFKYDHATSKLVDATAEATLEAGANDIIYTVDDTQFAPITDTDSNATKIELEDLGKVIVWVKA